MRMIKRRELKSKPNRWTPKKDGERYRTMSMAYALGHHAPKQQPEAKAEQPRSPVRERKRKLGVRKARKAPLEWLPKAEFSELHSAHLKSAKWKKIKAKLFRLRGRKCERCGSVERIEVHHKHYNNLGRERMRDLEILCRPCHAAHHGKPA